MNGMAGIATLVKTNTVRCGSAKEYDGRNSTHPMRHGLAQSLELVRDRLPIQGLLVNEFAKDHCRRPSSYKRFGHRWRRYGVGVHGLDSFFGPNVGKNEVDLTREGSRLASGPHIASATHIYCFTLRSIE
jgi:hypothetical protein